MRELHLFAGIGGGILGGVLLGHRPVCAVEVDGYCRRVLLQRQRDGVLPWFPIWDDVRTFDATPWRGLVDCVAGGFPCQDISNIGSGKGIEGPKSSLWGEMARVIAEVRPQYVFVENSPLLVGRGLALVLGQLAEMGFDAQWGIVSAADCGAPHIRKRLWILGHTPGSRLEERQGIGSDSREELTPAERTSWWVTEPNVGRVADGGSCRVDRLKALGGAQVPVVAATAWRLMMNESREN